jgi:hypothetical protein
MVLWCPTVLGSDAGETGLNPTHSFVQRGAERGARSATAPATDENVRLKASHILDL